MKTDLKKVQFSRSYERPNLILASHGFCRKYGEMSQEDKLFNIQALDSTAARQPYNSHVWRQSASTAQDYRLWFTICEWLKSGVFTEHTCVVFQRKYQDYENALAETKRITKKYDAELFGYPTAEPTVIFILYPKDRSEKTLRSIKDEVNCELHQWSYKPAFFSDIRTRPLRNNLINGNNDCSPCVGHKYLHEEW